MLYDLLNRRQYHLRIICKHMLVLLLDSESEEANLNVMNVLWYADISFLLTKG